MGVKKPRSFTYDYPRPALTADVAVVSQDARPRVLLIRRKKPPFAGHWALPGGFVDENERPADAAVRELKEESGIEVRTPDLDHLYTAGDPGRDPRGWTVSVVYITRVDASAVKPKAADDARAVKWWPLDALPALAFDHAMLLERARARILDKGV
jgi:8-oxo-dGTP diphosphatase